MSVTSTQRERYDCDRDACEQTFPKGAGAEGSYCSQRCADLVTGRNLVQHIQRDHRFCHNCFRQVKEIERVDKTLIVGPVEHDSVADTFADCIVGYEHLTEHGELGERQDGHYVLDEDAGGRAPSGDAVVTGTVCSCGTTDHRDDYLRREGITSTPAAARRLCDILALLGREDQHDKTVDATQLVDAVGGDPATADWERAVGEAIEPR
ncbi:hypothetical protein [Halosimplex pelagicum]|uniref:Uncharacterized protein n=1 Tax=Halosimplex pelagicum TaxID=869886 RepID=A0A7D5P807_9EURY|nr:hypothetical protein [Halosimplex pelagicum]QLH80964.1 hypothetical protein HZS54_04635 [Halosimplex pelagicum]